MDALRIWQATSRDGSEFPRAVAGKARIRAALRICVLTVCGAIATMPATSAFAADRASMVIDVNTGKVLHASQADALRYPASLTKVMTMFIAFDELVAGRLKFDSRIRMSAKAADVQPSKLGLKEGETISLRNAIKALITKSANDVAIAVAEHISGSEDAFARHMTKRARQLGMSRTTFTNASGLPDSDQVTTARDMLTMATQLMDVHGQHYYMFSMRSFTYKGRRHGNHNGLLKNFPGTDGLKTGYTRASGFNLLATARRGRKHVAGVVFGGKSASDRNGQMRRLLTKAFGRAGTTKPRQPLLVAKRDRPSREQATPPQPRLVLRTAPQRVTRQVEEAPRQFAQPPAAPFAPPPALAAPAQPPVRIARVRPTGFPGAIAQRQAVAATMAPPSSPFAAGLQQGRLPREVAPGAAAGVKLGRPPSTFGQQVAQLEQAAATPAYPANNFSAQPQAAQAFAQPFPPPPRSARASAALRPAITPPAYGLRGPEVPGDGYHVQVGAFATVGEAQQRIAQVRQQASSLLEGHGTVTVPFSKANKRYYRARFAGFDSAKATATCNELRRRQVDCFVARAQ